MNCLFSKDLTFRKNKCRKHRQSVSSQESSIVENSFQGVPLRCLEIAYFLQSSCFLHYYFVPFKNIKLLGESFKQVVLSRVIYGYFKYFFSKFLWFKTAYLSTTIFVLMKRISQTRCIHRNLGHPMIFVFSMICNVSQESWIKNYNKIRVKTIGVKSGSCLELFMSFLLDIYFLWKS